MIRVRGGDVMRDVVRICLWGFEMCDVYVVVNVTPYDFQ